MPAETFGDYCARLVEQQRRDLRDAIDDATEKAVQQTVESSGRAKTIAWMDAHPRGGLFHDLVFSPKLDHAARLLQALDQHALALQLMLPVEPLVGVPMMTVYRAMFEATAQLCHLFDHTVPPDKMAARAVAAQIDALQGTERMASHFQGEDIPLQRAADVRDALEKVLAYFTDEGAVQFATSDRGKFKHHVVTVKIGPHTQNVRLNASEAIHRHIGDDWHYELGSGVAHSLPWALPSFVDGFEEAPMKSRDFDTRIVLTEGVFLCADAISKAVEGETGYSTADQRKRTLTRRKGLLRAGRNIAPTPIGLEEFESRPRNYQGQTFPDDYAKAFRKP